MFSESEIRVLKNKLNLAGVGRLFGVSDRYVSQILHNKRRVKSATSLKIFNYLKANLDQELEKAEQ